MTLKSRLALGTVQFGMPYGIANETGQVTRHAVKAMLQMASGAGIDILDTAITYGESETCLGQVGVQNFKLVTKLPAVPESCTDVSAWVQEQFNASLARLGVKDLYGLVLHRPQQLLEVGGVEIYESLQLLKTTGMVQKVGVSIYAPSELEALTSQYRLDLIQAPFNLVDRRLHTDGWLKRLKYEGIEIHTRSTFLQGLLLMPYESIPKKFSRWLELWKKWRSWLLSNNITAIEASLAYPLSFPEIDRVVVGADSVRQLKGIISAADIDVVENLPDLQCKAEDLINPARWSQL